MDEAQFWSETRRRRNLFFLVTIGWLIYGIPLWLFYSWVLSLVFPTADSMVSGVAALITWMAAGNWASQRVTTLQCFKCGQKAFSNPFFFMKDAKCQSCGVSCRDT